MINRLLVLAFIVLTASVSFVCAGLYETVRELKEREWVLLEVRATPSGAIGVGKLMSEEQLSEHVTIEKAPPPGHPTLPGGGRQY